MKKILQRMSNCIENHPKRAFIVTGVLLVLSIFGIAQVRMSMGMDLYIDEDSEVNQNWQRLQSEFGKWNEVFLKLDINKEKWDIYEPETMELIEKLDWKLYDTGRFTFVTSPAHPVKSWPWQGDLLDTREENKDSILATRDNHRTADIMIETLIPDEYTWIIIAQYGNIDMPSEYASQNHILPVSQEEIIEKEVSNIIQEFEADDRFDITMTWAPIFENAAFGLMLPEIIKLFGVAFVIIFAIVYIVMKNDLEKPHYILLPLWTYLISLIVMVGFMGIVGYEFNAIMLGVLPIALGLSIDYWLQIQTRFLEERSSWKDSIASATKAIQTTGKSLMIAMITTLIGLGSLLISRVPPVRQFGVVSGFSIFISMFLSLTLLPVLLIKFDVSAIDKPDNLNMEKIFYKFTNFIVSKSKLILVAALIVWVAGVYSYTQVETTQEMFDYWPDIQQKTDLENLEDTVDSPQIMHVILDFDENAYTKINFQKVDNFQRELEDLEYVNTILSSSRAIQMKNDDELPSDEDEFGESLHAETQTDRPPALWRDYEEFYPNSFLIQLCVEDVDGKPVRSLIDNIYAKWNEKLSDLDISVTGKPVLNRNVIENVTAGLTQMTFISFVLGVVFLSIIFVSIKTSVLLVGSVSVLSVLMLAVGMYLFSIPWNPLTVTVASIILWVWVDYGVHIYERYIEEKSNWLDKNESIAKAISQKVRPILWSGLTTMFGFGVLVISDFPVLANFGRAIMLAMFASLFTAFVVLPAIISLLD